LFYSITKIYFLIIRHWLYEFWQKTLIDNPPKLEISWNNTQNIIPTSQETRYVSIKEPNQFTQHKEIILYSNCTFSTAWFTSEELGIYFYRVYLCIFYDIQRKQHVFPVQHYSFSLHITKYFLWGRNLILKYSLYVTSFRGLQNVKRLLSRVHIKEKNDFLFRVGVK